MRIYDCLRYSTHSVLLRRGASISTSTTDVDAQAITALGQALLTSASAPERLLEVAA